MTEYRLFTGDVAHVSTAEFHRDRERARHLEQATHRGRLIKAAEYVRRIAYRSETGTTVSDLGCGDGGLLSLVRGDPRIADAWGYDFSPANAAGWAERGVRAELLDVFGADWYLVEFGTVTVVTEVLEHLTNPHGAVRWIGEHSPWIVASSPYTENDVSHDGCHAWAWDDEGYDALLARGGYRVVERHHTEIFQVVMATREEA